MGVSPIGSLRRWPCVGDPEAGPMFSCGAEGSLSLLGIVEAGRVADFDDPAAPLVVHMTACRSHVRVVRRWLEARGRGDAVDTYSTEVLMGMWGQVIETLGVPVWQYTRRSA